MHNNIIVYSRCLTVSINNLLYSVPVLHIVLSLPTSGIHDLFDVTKANYEKALQTLISREIHKDLIP